MRPGIDGLVVISFGMLFAGWSGAGEVRPTDPTARLHGRFVYDGPIPTPAVLNVPGDRLPPGQQLFDESLVVGPRGGIANVVIYVRSKVDLPGNVRGEEHERVVMTLKDCRARPHVIALPVQATLCIVNGELDTNYNIVLNPVADRSLNTLLRPREIVAFQFHRRQAIPQRLVCSIQPWISAYILPRESALFAVSKQDGSFSIDRLPVSKLEFQVWHERAGDFRQLQRDGWSNGRFEFDLKPGDNEMGVIALDATLFNRPALE